MPNREEIPCPLHRAAERQPDAPALDSPAGRLTYGELDDYVSGTARRLQRAGTEPGDRVGIVLENGRESVVLILAVMRAGAVACPISTRLPPASARRRMVDLGARLAVSSVPFEGALDPVDVIASARGLAYDIPSDRPATIVFTSGSSGPARAALHTYGNHYYSALGSNENISLGPGDRWLLSLPIYHVGGLAILFRCLLARATVSIPDRGADLVASLDGVTHASMVSTQLWRLLRGMSGPSSHTSPSGTSTRATGGLGGASGAATSDIQPKKALLLGGSAIPATLIDEAILRDLPIHTSYGLTEMASQVATTAPGASREELATSGRVLPHREARIDASGQVLVRGATRFAGYVDGTELRRPFDEEGWFATGDLGQLDAAGRLIVRGRVDNMFLSGGENVLPEEIEAAMMRVQDVERVVVVPVEHAEFGHRPVAFVETKRDAPAGGRETDRDRPEQLDERLADELRGAVAADLPGFMVPDAFFAWPEQATSGLKVNRRRLKALAREAGLF
ncbi:MAG: AMP-binding protein [Rhodothermales bacterium]